MILLFLPKKEPEEPIITYANHQSTYQDERPISGSGNYNIPDTSSTFEYTRSQSTKEQTVTTEKTSFQAAPVVQTPVIKQPIVPS